MTPGGHTQVRLVGVGDSTELSVKNTLDRHKNQQAAIIKSSPVPVYGLTVDDDAAQPERSTTLDQQLCLIPMQTCK